LTDAKYGNYNTLPMDTMHIGDTMHKRTWSKYNILWCQKYWTYFFISIWRLVVWL